MVSGKPDGQVSEDMPGGSDFLKFSANTQGIKWPQFNENAQSIRNIKQEVKAHRKRQKAAKAQTITTPEEAEDLGDVLFTLGALIMFYQNEFDELEKAMEFELNIETVITQKSIKYPQLLNPAEPTKISINIPPKPTKVEIAYDSLSEELKRLRKMYQDGVTRNEELKAIKRKNTFIDAENGKIKTINDGIKKTNFMTSVEKDILNKRIRYLQSEIDGLGDPNILGKAADANKKILTAVKAQNSAKARETANIGRDVSLQRGIAPVQGQKMRNSRGEVIEQLPIHKSVNEIKADQATRGNINAALAKKNQLIAQLNEAKAELAKKRFDTFLDGQTKLGIFDRVDVEQIKKNIMTVLKQIEEIQAGNAAVSSELLQYQKDLHDAETKQAAADVEYNKKKIIYEQQKLNVKNAQNAFDRDIAFANLEAKRYDFTQAKINKDTLSVDYTFAKNQFTVKYLESPQISSILKRNMPPAVIAQYNDIINSFSTNITNPIANAYKSMITNLKVRVVAQNALLQFRKLNPIIRPITKSVNISKIAAFLKVGGGPFLELAGIALTTYSMLEEQDERLDDDTTDPFAEIAGRALESVANTIKQIDPYAGV